MNTIYCKLPANGNFFEYLPNEVKLLVFKYLGDRAANTARRVCKEWKKRIDLSAKQIYSPHGLKIKDKYASICNVSKGKKIVTIFKSICFVFCPLLFDIDSFPGPMQQKLRLQYRKEQAGLSEAKKIFRG